jgi:uncharacterized DUF497 family protein
MKDHLGHFEWDDKKAALNMVKHGVDFEEAALSFFDQDFIRLPDTKHSVTEERYAGKGRTPLGKMIVTNYTERGLNIRIISSRLANKKERKKYEDRKN